MSKMMIVAATSEKMLELMDKITIEEGVISFLASNKATAKGYPCMFSVEGKTTTASVKFEAKIKGLDEKGEVVPVEKLSVYLPARFAGSVRAVAEQTDIVYMQFEEKQVTLLSQKPAIQIPVSFVEEPTKVKNPKTDAFSMSIPLEKAEPYSNICTFLERSAGPGNGPNERGTVSGSYKTFKRRYQKAASQPGRM